MSESTAVELGQRVMDKKGIIGTVRYVGSVPTAKDATVVYAGTHVPASADQHWLTPKSNA